MTSYPPEGLIDWHGKPWDINSGKPAHPNSRFTAPAYQNPAIDEKWDHPQGAPIDGFFWWQKEFSGAPVCQSFNWNFGVYMAQQWAVK